MASSTPEIERNSETNISQWLAELAVVHDFYLRADSSGLQLPEDSQILRSLLIECVRRYQQWWKPIIDKTWKAMPDEWHWPPTALLSLVALAQHYGVPTRLLDWSRSPFTAAYFAAIDGCRKNSNRISVWSLLATSMASGKLLQGSNPKFGVRLGIVTAPRAANPNLHAQDGLFTICMIRPHCPTKSVVREPINELLTEESNPYFNESPLFFHFTLPRDQSPEVLWHLDKIGINAARLFPSFEGAARAIEERLLQRQPEVE